MTRNTPVLLCLLSCTACSSIIEGTSQDIAINTFPAGASCTLLRNGQPIATVTPTPGSALVRKTKYDVSVLCDKPGYARAAYLDQSGTASATIGDIMVPGVGWAIDSVSGADNKYTTPVNLTLAPVPTPPPQATPQAAAAPAATLPQNVALMYYPGSAGQLAQSAGGPMPFIPPGYALVPIGPAAAPPATIASAAPPATIASAAPPATIASAAPPAGNPPAIPPSPVAAVPDPALPGVTHVTERTGMSGSRSFDLPTGYLPAVPPIATAAAAPVAQP